MISILFSGCWLELQVQRDLGNVWSWPRSRLLNHTEEAPVPVLRGWSIASVSGISSALKHNCHRLGDTFYCWSPFPKTQEGSDLYLCALIFERGWGWLDTLHDTHVSWQTNGPSVEVRRSLGNGDGQTDKVQVEKLGFHPQYTLFAGDWLINRSIGWLI